MRRHPGRQAVLWSKAFPVLALLAIVLRLPLPSHAETTDYQYDELGRLIDTADTGGNTIDYGLDPAGNRTGQTVAVGAGAGPHFTVSDAQVEEGGSLAFTVTLNKGTGGTYAVSYATADGSAVALGDYTAQSGTLTFTGATGNVSQTVSVTTADDGVKELDNETLAFNLSAPTGGAVLADGGGTGAILTGDSLNHHPKGVAGSIVGSPGDSFHGTNIGCDPDGDPVVISEVTDPSSKGTFVVDPDLKGFIYTITSPDPAQLGDFIQFKIQDPFGATGVSSLSVEIIFVEPAPPGGGPPLFVAQGEPILAASSSSSCAPAGNDQEEPSPDNVSFSIGDVAAAEGSDLVFTVTRSGSASETYHLEYATANGTASANDYVSVSGGLTFASFQTTNTITVATTTDGVTEGNETVVVNLTNPSGGAVLLDGQGVGTITEGGTPDSASFAIDDVSVTEGGSLVFTVTKSGTATQSYSVNYATANGTASAGDYTAASGTLVFGSLETAKTITVPTTQDSTVEANETVLINLSGATGGAVISDAQGVGTIVNDDDPPGSISFAINDVSVTEGGSLVFTVTRTGTASTAYSVNYATANGTASSSDYTAASGTLTFAIADTTKTVTVATTQDSTAESDETVLVNLSNATSGATLTDSQGVGTIVNDDQPDNVSFAINDVSAAEGLNLVFTITKSGTASTSYSVNYATANGTATAGTDYTSKSGTLTYTTSQTIKTVIVATSFDVTVEPNETILMNLSGATGGAVLSDSQGVGTILNDDAGGNSAPNAVDDTASGIVGFPKNVQVLSNDTDPNGDPLTITQLSSTAFFTIGCTATCIIVDAPEGVSTVTYSISDGRGGGDSAVLTFTTNPEPGGGSLAAPAAEPAVGEEGATEKPAADDSGGGS